MEELTKGDLYNIIDMFAISYNEFGYDEFSESEKETLNKLLLLHFLAEFKGED